MQGVVSLRSVLLVDLVFFIPGVYSPVGDAFLLANARMVFWAQSGQ
jgi:hypothetical protein